MGARIDSDRVQSLTRTGLDWTAKYPSAATALASVNVKTAYLDGALCGVDETGLPSFAHTGRSDPFGRPLRNGRLEPNRRPQVRPQRAHRGSEQHDGLKASVAVLRLPPRALDSCNDLLARV